MCDFDSVSSVIYLLHAEKWFNKISYSARWSLLGSNPSVPVVKFPPSLDSISKLN